MNDLLNIQNHFTKKTSPEQVYYENTKYMIKINCFYDQNKIIGS
jgi:hypothetical protein